MSFQCKIQGLKPMLQIIDDKKQVLTYCKIKCIHNEYVAIYLGEKNENILSKLAFISFKQYRYSLIVASTTLCHFVILPNCGH